MGNHHIDLQRGGLNRIPVLMADRRHRFVNAPRCIRFLRVVVPGLIGRCSNQEERKALLRG